MAGCDICQDLSPLGFELLQPGQRAVIFAVASAVQEKARKGCQSCLLVWRAVTLFRDDWSPKDLGVAIELQLSPCKPVTLFFRPRGPFGVALDIYTKAGRRLTAAKGVTLRSIGPAVEVQRASGSPQALNNARAWLDTCVESHKLCLNLGDSIGPARLIDLGLSRNSLVHLVDAVIGIGPYMALSYCWGKDQTMTTTKETIGLRKAGIPVETMPQTYQDAIAIAHFLGIQYLWIDALCIIQGDTNDWAAESAKMCSIYENARLTVSADNSSSASAGIFSDQDYAASFPLTEYKNAQVYARKCLSPLHRITEPCHNLDEDMPLYHRAWTLQEGTLSTRTLRFTGRELVWECNEVYHCECGNQKTSQTDFTNRIFRNPSILEGAITKLDLDVKWIEFVEKFTEQELTCPSDKLVAISGLAKKMRAVTEQITGTEDTYLAGLWLSNLTRGLLWQKLDDFFMKRGIIASTVTRQAEWRAPTWSWASMDGSTILHPPTPIVSKVDLVQYEYRLATEDHTGQLLYASLTLRGLVTEVALVVITEKASDGPRGRVQGLRLGVRSLRGGMDYPFVADDIDLQAIQSQREKIFYCLLIAMHEEPGLQKSAHPLFLVLRESFHKAGAFERVGANHMDLNVYGLGRYSTLTSNGNGKKIDLFEGAEENTVTII